MDFLAIFVVVFVLVWALRRQIIARPGLFYACAIACNALLIANTVLPLPRWVLSLVSPLMQKGGLGIALFLIVMWIGVFPRESRLSRDFRPMRGELSVMACIFIVGHMYVYLASYVPRIIAGVVPKNSVTIALLVACLLFALMVPLGLTSLRAVKRCMKACTWRRIQGLAYAFYGLAFVHVLLMLGPSAMAGSERSMVMVSIYSALFGGYMVARIARAVLDRHEQIDLG